MPLNQFSRGEDKAVSQLRKAKEDKEVKEVNGIDGVDVNPLVNNLPLNRRDQLDQLLLLPLLQQLHVWDHHQRKVVVKGDSKDSLNHSPNPSLQLQLHKTMIVMAPMTTIVMAGIVTMIPTMMIIIKRIHTMLLMTMAGIMIIAGGMTHTSIS